MDIDRAALLQLFLSDSEEDLARLETSVLALEDRPNDADGVAAILALDGFARVAHALEDVLHLVRTRQRAVTGELVTLVLGTVDALRGMLAALRAGEGEDPARHKALAAELAAFAAGRAEADSPRESDDAALPPSDDTPHPMDGRTIDGRTMDGRTIDGRSGPALRIEMAKVDQLLDLAARALVVQG